MKTTVASPSSHRAAFTLIEMIGVLAIMAIVAATIAPNALRTIDRATVRAEASLLHDLDDQVKTFLKAKGWLPGLNPVVANRLSWDQDLWKFTDISPADLLTNKRQMTRSYIYEPVASPQRVLILSSMRAGLALPTAANLNSTALFDNVWNTVDGSLPSAAGQSWAGWAAWRNTLNGTAGDYLVIERVNLQSIYMAVTLTNNSTTTAVYYQVVPAVGPTYGAPIPKGALPVKLSLFPNDRLNLYNTGVVAPQANYVYVASSGLKVIDFNDTKFWTPQ